MAPLLIGAVVGCLIFYFIPQGLPQVSFFTESMFCWWLSFSTVARFVTKENLTVCLRRKRMKTDKADNISAYQSGYLTIKNCDQEFKNYTLYYT